MKKFVIPAVATAVLVSGVALVACTNEQAVATVNGTNITSEEVDQHFAQIPANVIGEKEEEIRKNIIERLIEQQLVLQNAEETGVYDDKEFKNQLKLMTENLAYNFAVKNALDAELTDTVVKAEYEKILPSLKEAIVHARHILVKTEDEAKAVIKELDGGADFVELAKTKSTGPSAANGGDLGFFKAGQMVKPFSDAAFAMEKGKHSMAPVQTQFGWHVIKVEDKKFAKAPTFEEIADQLRQNLSQGVIQKYITGLRESAKIDYKG